MTSTLQPIKTKLSIIAVLFEGQYYSIKCFHDGASNLHQLLCSRQNSETSAARFVSMGDVELTKKNGLLVLDSGKAFSSDNKTQSHRSPLKLVTYALDNEAENLHLYEDGQWEMVHLLSEEDEVVC